MRGTAWILVAEPMPVSRAAAPALRLGRIEDWLDELGYQTCVLRRGREVDRASAHRRPSGRGTASAAADALLALLRAPGLARRARRYAPTLVLTNTALQAPALALVKLALGRRVVTVVDLIGIRSQELEHTARLTVARRVYRPAWRGLERLLLSSADLVLTVNDRHAAHVRAIRPGARIHVLRDAAEPELAAVKVVDRKALGLPGAAVLVGFVGSLVCSRLDPILGVWGELVAERRRAGRAPIALVVAGDGPDLDRYRRRAATEGWLGTSVFFLGALPRERALGAMRACDIAYCGSWSRAGFSFKLFEYMALPLPIVVEDKPQMREVLRDGHDALLVGGPGELAAALSRLADDEDLRRRLALAARQTLLTGHTVDRRRRQLAAALEEARA